MEQIRYKTIHGAVQLGDRSEGQGVVICLFLELGCNGERGWVNLQDQVESEAGLLLHKTIQMLLAG